jgi:hypothetical protein
MRQQGMVGGNHLKEGRERVVILQIFRGLEASLALSGRRERQRERAGEAQQQRPINATPDKCQTLS